MEACPSAGVSFALYIGERRRLLPFAAGFSAVWMSFAAVCVSSADASCAAGAVVSGADIMKLSSGSVVGTFSTGSSSIFVRLVLAAKTASMN